MTSIDDIHFGVCKATKIKVYSKVMNDFNRFIRFSFKQIANI